MGQAFEPDLAIVAQLGSQPISAEERVRKPPGLPFKLPKRLRQPPCQSQIIEIAKPQAVISPQ
jgi:hypothetical protein